MGHYRSEMGFEKQDALEAEEREKRRIRVAANIIRDIDARGIGQVLADIILDDYHNRSKYDR